MMAQSDKQVELLPVRLYMRLAPAAGHGVQLPA